MRRGALIGFGEVAEKAHAPAWKEDGKAAIVAAAEANAARRKAAETAFPGLRAYPDLESLLSGEKELDFVDIATPPHLHARQCLTALRAGKHVLCEKPLALSAADFSLLARTAEAENLALFSTHNWKYAPLFAKLRRLLNEGAVGALRHIEWHVLRTRPAAVAVRAKGNWRTDTKLSGGGILIDHGWHAIYLLCWLAGKPPLSASGVLKPSGSADGKGGRDSAEEEATALIDFGDISAAFHLTWRAEERGHWGIVRGDAGSIRIEDDRLVVSRGGIRAASYAFAEPLSRASAHPDWFRDMLKDFHAAMDKPSGKSKNLDEARHCVELIEKLYERGSR